MTLGTSVRPPNARYAIHIIRRGRDGRAPELLLTHKERGAFDVIQNRARDLLWTFPQFERGDFVVVRLVLNGQEVYRWAGPD
jgi:hypothetical protein